MHLLIQVKSVRCKVQEIFAPVSPVKFNKKLQGHYLDTVLLESSAVDRYRTYSIVSLEPHEWIHADVLTLVNSFSYFLKTRSGIFSNRRRIFAKSNAIPSGHLVYGRFCLVPFLYLQHTVVEREVRLFSKRKHSVGTQFYF